MDKNKLTVIIPFLNEGVEVENTVKSIRDTAGNEVDILLLNDDSTDDFDYYRVALKYDAIYYQNKERKGVAESRNIGVSLIKTPYFVLIDGHMRFYHNNWWNEFVRNLEEDDRAVYSGSCLDLDAFGHVKNIEQKAFGAFINFTRCSPMQILEPTWITVEHTPDSSKVKIPCVLGASYALSVRYWNYIHGLEGLRYYGNDESYLSLKIWLEGGECILLKNVKIGHIFREEPPYKMLSGDRIYNKILISRLLLPEWLGNKVEENIKINYASEYSLVESMFRKNYKYIDSLKMEYENIFRKDISLFIDLNKNEEFHVDGKSKSKNRLREIASSISDKSISKVGLMTGEIGEILFLYEYAYKQNSIFYKKRADNKLKTLLKEVKNKISHYNIYSGAAGLGLGLKYLSDKNYINFDWNSFMSEIEKPMLEFMKEQICKNNLGLLNGSSGIALYFLEKGIDVINDVYMSKLIQMSESDHCDMKNGILGIVSFLIYAKEKNINLNMDELIKLYIDKIKLCNVDKKLCYESGDLIKSYILYKSYKSINNQIMMKREYEYIVSTCKRRDDIIEDVNDASLCNGSAGTSLIYYLINKDQGDESLKSAYEYWLNDISCKANNLETELFIPSNNKQYSRGILYGTSGIGLSLMSIISEEIPLWKIWIGL